MSGYCVRILRPPGYIHSRVFEVAARAFEGALTDLDIYDDRGTPIIFGAHLNAPVVDGAILYQTEVLDSPWMNHGYLNLLRKHRVLDYDEKNVEWLKANGVDATHCPIGYHRSMTRLTMKPEAERDIDVLFYGSFTPRRVPILESIQATGLTWRWIGHDEWDKTDDAITRSKIVLNIHAYENSPFEIFRVSYLLANGVFVLSEGFPEQPYMCSVMWRMTDQIAEACVQAIEDIRMRKDMAKVGQSAFMKRTQADILKGVLV
jgi:hypothetical protein